MILLENRFKIQIFLVSALFIGLMGYAFYNPSITGHVSANIYRQNLNLMINESQNFLLTSNELDSFFITSFKISGNITGNGQVKVYIDTGTGQKVLVYENMAGKKEDKNTGLISITGRVIEIVEARGVDEGVKRLVFRPIETLLEKEVFDEVGRDLILVNGAFTEQCIDTCFMHMEISKNISYRIVFLVEKGTVLRINDIVFQIAS